MKMKKKENPLSLVLVFVLGLAYVIFMSYFMYQKLKELKATFILWGFILFLLIVAAIVVLTSLKNKTPWLKEQWCGWHNRHEWLIRRAAWMKDNKGIGLRRQSESEYSRTQKAQVETSHKAQDAPRTSLEIDKRRDYTKNLYQNLWENRDMGSKS